MFAELLADNGVQFKHAAGGELVLDNCLWCPDGDPRGGNCYVNGQNGFVWCFRCGHADGPSGLARFFGVEIDMSDEEKRCAVLTDFLAIAQGVMWGESGHEARDWLNARGLTDDTVREFGLGLVTPDVPFAQDMGTLHDHDLLRGSGLFTDRGCFFDDCIVIPYRENGRIVSLQGRTLHQGARTSYLALPGRPLPLFNADSVGEGATVIMTEGALDCLRVWQEVSDRFTVVGLPGVRSCGPEVVNLARRAKRMLVAFDSDQPGRDAASKVTGQVGPKAVPVFPERGKDWTDAANAGEDIRSVLVRAWQSSKRLVTLAEAGVRFREQFSGKRFRTGLASLDLVSGGFRQGQVVVPIARSGSGKSVMLANWTYAMRQNNILVASLELTSGELYSMIEKVHLGNSPADGPEDIPGQYPNVLVYDDNRLNVDRLDDLLDEYEEDAGVPAEVVMIDYLQYAARGSDGAEYERATRTIMQLKAVAKRRKVLIICPSQVNRASSSSGEITLNSARGSGVIEETADFVFGLWRADNDPVDPSPTRGALSLSVLKSRSGGQGSLLSLRFCPFTLRVVDPSDQVRWAQAEKEWAFEAQGGTYEQWLQQQNVLDIMSATR